MFRESRITSRWVRRLVRLFLFVVVPAPVSAALHAGFLHQAVGNASLTLDHHGLVVASLPSAGVGAGVRVRTGSAEGVASRLGIDSRQFPLGTRLTATARGIVGGASVEAARLEVERTEGGYVLAPAFPGLGAVSYRLELYLGDDQAHAAGGLTGVAGSVVWPGTLGPELAVHRGGALVLTGFPDQASGGGFRLPGGAVVDADSAVFLAETAVADADHLDALELTVDRPASFILNGHDLVFWRARHRAIGSLLVPASGSLRVEAPHHETHAHGGPLARGDGAPIGVEIELGDSQGWWLVTDGLSPEDLPTGAWLAAQTFGTVDGVADRQVVSTRLEVEGSMLEASFDFTPLLPAPGDALYTVEILLDGEVMASQSGVGLRGSSVRFATAPSVLDPWLPSGFPPDPFPPGQLPEYGGRPLLSLLFEEPVPISLSGGSPNLSGDEIRAYPDFEPRPVGSASRLTVLTSGVPAIAFRDATFMKAQKIHAGLDVDLDGWLVSCSDAVAPASQVKTFVCLANDTGQSVRNIEVTAAVPKGLLSVGRFNLSVQQGQNWRSGPLLVPARAHCPVGFEGRVGLQPSDYLESEFTIERSGVSTRLRLLNFVLPTSGFLPPHPAIPTDCLAICHGTPAHLCPEPPPAGIFADGFESGDTSAWSTILP